MTIKFLADHNVPESIVSQLEKSGIDITSLKREEKSEASDEEVMKTAIEDGRAVLTIDKDFISGLEEEFEHQGIVIFQERYEIGEMIRDVQKVVSTFSTEELENTTIHLPWS